MSVQDTSAKSYEENWVKFAVLGGKVLDLITRVSDGEGITNHEIATYLQIDTATVSGLTRPLVIKGLVYRLKKRKCGVTGNTAIAWAREVYTPTIVQSEQAKQEQLL